MGRGKDVADLVEFIPQQEKKRESPEAPSLWELMRL